MSDLYRWNPDTAIEEVWKAVQVEPLRQDLIRDGVLVPVEPADRAWFCSYTLPNRWSGFDYACNPNNPRQGDDCDERCGWYLMVKEDDDE